MLKRKFFTMAIAAAMTILMSMTALASGGNWQKDETGWWYGNGDGTKATTGWYWLDGNQDGVSECYFFDGKGYLMTNVTTADGFFVNADGAWTVDGVVQTRSAVPVSVENNDSGTVTGNTQLVKDNGGYNSYGCSIAALDMLNSSREENAKYVEVEVDEITLRTCVMVTYANGFCVQYPIENHQSKYVSVSKTRIELDGTYLFQYFNSSLSVDDAAQLLLNNGWTWGTTGKYAFSNGLSCHAKVSDDYHTIEWNSNHRINLR